MGSLHFEPLIPPSLWMALAVAGAALLVWYGIRRPEAIERRRWFLSLGLMAAAFGAVLLVLLNPTWVTEVPPPAGKPLLTVLVDDSGSMAMPDGGGGATRYQAAARLAAVLASKLDNQFDVQVRTFSDTSAALDVKDLAARVPKGQGTDLASAVAESLAEDRPQGQATVLLSDGIHNTGGGAQPVLDAVRRSKSMAAPVYTRTFGGGEASIDLAVDMRSSQDLAFIGQKVPVGVRITARGIKGGRADVTLLYDGKEVGRQPVDLGGGIAAPEARFWVQQDKTGLYPYEARIDPLPGEATQANNSATYLLRVVDQPVRVLLVEGKPYWDAKFLMRTLSSVPAVELDSVVRVAEGRLMWRTIARQGSGFRVQGSGEEGKGGTAPASTGDPKASGAAAATGAASAAPSDPEPRTLNPEPSPRTDSWKIVNDAAEVFSVPERLRRYQIVVLGREAEAFLTDAAVANLQNWVSQDGGALVCARGSPTAQVNQRLAKLLPVKWTPTREARFRMRLTDEGRDLRWLGDGPAEDRRLAGLPTLASSAQIDRSKPLAVVLATGSAPGGASGGGAGAGALSPAVVYQPYGGGRVIVIEGAGMWRWAFLPPQYQQQEEVYAALWHSLLRWVTSGVGLMPGQKLALRADKVSFATEEPATATLLVREEAGKGQAPTVELFAPGAKEPRIVPVAALGEEPGSFRVNFGKLPAGRYQARVAGSGAQDVASRCVFDVRVLGQEQLDLQARPDLMARVAVDSGGAVLSDDAVDEITKKFKEHMARTRPPRYERNTAWDRWYVLVAVFGLWGLAWAVRRSGGLV